MSNVDSFVQRNRNFIVGAAVALGVTGAALYYTTQVNKAATTQDSSDSSSKCKKKKPKKKPSSKKTSETSDSSSGSSGANIYGFPLTKDSATGASYPAVDVDDKSKLSSLSDAQRKEMADMLKTAGNAAFKAQDNDKALKLYTEAIAVNDSDAIYYSNRAAVLGALSKYEEVVRDTSKALELCPDYVKCYSRRALAYEKLLNYKESVMDYTAACILSNFEDESLARSVDRVLRLQAEKIVAEKNSKVEDAPKKLPSPAFIGSYLASFNTRTVPEDAKNATDEDSAEYKLKMAFDALDKGNLASYEQAFALFKEANEQGLKSDIARSSALEYIATFLFLLNDIPGAIKYANESIEIHPTASSLVKRSTVLVENGELEKASEDFQRAEMLEPENADVKYQLAQLAFIQQNWPVAIDQYNKAIELDPTFLLAHIQLAVTRYRMNEVETAKQSFKDLIAKYPENSHVHNYYGEILLDLKDYENAVREFDISIDLENKKAAAAINVLPLINKALATIATVSTTAGIETAISLCRQAVAIDPSSDIAIGTLAQFCLQNNQTEEAIKLFERNADLARSHSEQIQAITFAEASKTHHLIAQERPVLRERVELLSRYGRSAA